MTTIFISYKRENLAAVQEIVQGLRGAGLDVWWDQDIAPDNPWEATIERQLEAAKVVIVAWSPAAVASENVKAEARRARQQGKLIQTFVEPCEPPLFFGERQGVDLTGWSGDANDRRFRTILEAARAILAGRRPPQGVGYAPRKRTPWAALTAAFLFLSAVLGFVSDLGGARAAVCSIYAMDMICPEPSPPTITREAVLRSLEGWWGADTTRAPRCAMRMHLAVTRGEDGVDRVRASSLTGNSDFGWTMRVISVDTESRNVVLKGEDEVEYRYRIDAEGGLTVIEPPRVGETRPRESTLPRCPDN